MLQLLLAKLGTLPGLRAEPTRVERWLVHALYLVGFLLLVWPAAALLGRPVPIDIGTLVSIPLVVAATSAGFMLWSVRTRAIPPENWFLSHLVWLALTHVGLALFTACTALFLGVGILFAAVMPPLAFALVYGPALAGALVGLWYTYRLLRGWITFLVRAPLGSISDELVARTAMH